MALPWALAKLGWVIGLVLILVVALLCLYSGILLWRLHLAYPYGITYGNLAEAVCGGGGSPVSGPVMRNIVFCVGENSTCSAAGRDQGLTEKWQCTSTSSARWWCTSSRALRPCR